MQKKKKNNSGSEREEVHGWRCCVYVPRIVFFKRFKSNNPPSRKRLISVWTLGCPWESGNRKLNWKVHLIEFFKDVCQVQKQTQMLEVWFMKALGVIILHCLSRYILYRFSVCKFVPYDSLIQLKNAENVSYKLNLCRYKKRHIILLNIYSSE